MPASIPAAIADLPLIAVIRAQSSDDYPRKISPLVVGGVRAIELTLTTPGTIEALPGLRASLPPDVIMGVGTVRTVFDAIAAIQAGAEFLVSPHTDRAIIETGVSRGVPVFPGAVTATEMNLALASGATAIKLFPAGMVGPDLAKQLRAPFPELEFMPSGGVGLDDVGPWLRAGAVAVCVGGPLVGGVDATSDDIRDRARKYVAAVRVARP